MRYHQITPAERYTLATLRKQVPALSMAAIARLMGRHRSTISREIARNSSRRDRLYRVYHAQYETNLRRSQSGRNRRFGVADWDLVVRLLHERLSPDQISGRLRLEGRLFLNVQYGTVEFVDDEVDWFLDSFLDDHEVARKVLKRNSNNCCDGIDC